MIDLYKQYNNLNFFSPVHNFPFYNDFDYQAGLQMCLDFLPYCSEMWVYGDYKNSTGCLAEIDYCKKYHIPYKIITE